MLKASDYFTCPNLCALENMRHGFFTRNGGNSSGIYASLNCGPGSDDDKDTVMSNRDAVAETLGGELATCHQIHSNDVLTVYKTWQQKDAPQADAMVTNRPNIILGILTADCLPVLFADTKNPIIGAAHAGWRGAFAGILENTITAMETLGSQRTDIIATIGPAISQKSYEIGAEFFQRFLDQSPDNKYYFTPSKRNGHFLFDLKAYAKQRLELTGIGSINLLERDTCFEEDTFFSFRRATLKGEPSYGRQISAITIRQK